MKNLQNIRLALSVGLINQQGGNVLASIKDLMRSFSDEVGNFIDWTITQTMPLNARLQNQRYAIRYEKAVLNVDVVTTTTNSHQYVQGFDLR